MSERIDLHRIQDLGDGVGVARSNAIRDVNLLSVATEYRKETSRRYIQLSESEIGDRFAQDSRIAVSRKYDGEAVFVFYEASKKPNIFAFNAPSGQARLGFECLNEAARKLAQGNIEKALNNSWKKML